MCKKCAGSGELPQSKSITLSILPGTKEQVVKVVGGGLPGMNGGPSGDVLVEVRVVYPNMDTMSDEDRERLREILWPKDENTE
jgi:DnaJ-class molecular chaperone